MTTTYLNINGDVRDTASLTLPADRTFRNAWVYGEADVVEVDMPKAQEIFKDNIRRERKPLLEALDVEFMKTLETGGDVSAITAKKIALRNITDDARIASATTPEMLGVMGVASLIA
jgi:lipopolysaccharide export system protein LptA